MVLLILGRVIGLQRIINFGSVYFHPTIPMKNVQLLSAALVVIAVGGLAPSGWARPYASSLTNNAGTISFRLNESADSVKIVSAGGTVTNDLGALPAGLQTFALGISGVYQIEVFKAAEAGFATAIGPNRGAVSQIGSDIARTRFFAPRGLAVNTDPASPYFGRVYVSNPVAGTTTTGSRATGDGIYMLNADFSDAVGQGNTARTGGLDFGTGGAVSPYRLSIGESSELYITDWSDITGSLYVTDPNVSAGSGVNILGGPTGSPFPVTLTRIHGSIAAAIVTGSLAASNLTAFVIDEDLQTDRTATGQTMRNSLWRHDLTNGIPGPAEMPTLLRNGLTNWINFASQTMDLSRGPGTNGLFYVNNYRSVGSDRSGLTVLDTYGTNVIWSSLAATREFTGVANENDLLRATGGGAVSPRGDYVAVINTETNGITVLPLIDGIPDLTNRLVFHGMGNPQAFGTSGRDVAFDLAGNLYAVATNSQILRVFAPGGSATAITGSDGTFNIIIPPVTLRATVVDAQGSEEGPNPISFSIWRDGSTDAPLAVTYTLTGTASNGVDYVTNVLSATIPAGETNVTVEIMPIDDPLAEPAETVLLTVVPAVDYTIGSPAGGTGIIADNEPIIRVVALDNEGNEEGPDPVVFNIWRTDASIAGPVVVNYTLTGTASNGVDYVTNVLSATIAAGETNVLVAILPIDDTVAEFTETVTMTLVVSTDYTRGTPNNASGIIGDNEVPTLSIAATAINPFERFASNGITFVIERRGATNGDVFVAMSFSGTATIDADYVDPQNPNPVYMPVGAVTTNFTIFPIDDVSYEGNETVIATFIPNGYEVVGTGSATTTIIDDECPPETVLFGDNLNGDSSASWVLKFGANNNVADYAVDWAFDYSTIGIPPAPTAGGADSTGLRVTVNKNDFVLSSAGINLYPTGQSFSGDFALRFDLYINVGNSNGTEHTVAGINHSGLNTNRVSQTPANPISTAGADGIWFAIEAGAANLRDYGAYTSTNAATVPALIATRAATTLTSVITRPPYSFAGSPGNTNDSTTKAWAQVEISQTGNIVALSVNKRPIMQVTNTYGFNAGNVMIGYNDQFESRGGTNSFAIFDNVRVVRLGIAITDIEVTGNSVQLDFTSSQGEQAGDFRIESASLLEPNGWSTENGATIVANGSGFRATIPANGSTRFYRVAK
jgi:hypothetical protein